MPRKSTVPRGAVSRQCPVCNKRFKPMTDAQWTQNWARHLALSIRHERYLGLAEVGSSSVGNHVPTDAQSQGSTSSSPSEGA